MLQRRHFLRTLALLSLAPELRAAERQREELLVLAAASLTDVLESIGAAFTLSSGQRVRFSFAASSALARQIEAGGRVDAFLSADVEWMDYLQSRGLIAARSRRNVASNRLVLIAPKDSEANIKLAPKVSLLAALDGGRLATGDPDIVPAGRYAKAALQALGAWHDIARRVIFADNVRSALAYVARGEAPLGIVYATDAQIDPRVRIVDVFPADTHPPILYPAAPTVHAHAGTQAFLDFLARPKAQAAFIEYGFQPLPSGR